MNATPWTPHDRAELEARGISVEEAERQLRLLRHPPAPVRLVRPCTLGDGVVGLDAGDHEELLSRYETAATAGRIMKFVPASGAASRMFGDLAAAAADPGLSDPGRVLAASPDSPLGVALAVARSLDRFAFGGDVFAALAARRVSRDDLDHGRRLPDLVAIVLTELNLAGVPKGLVPFHLYAEGPRTAFQEHLAEAISYARDGSGTVRARFTVPESHRHAFAEAGRRWAETVGETLDLGFSVQDPSTDTLAADETGAPFRNGDGSLLFRPGGHGSLIRNLQETQGDIVLVKNIDNVVPDHRKEPTLLWKKLLCGYLLRLESESAGDHPIRVCGVVRNQGEPGGGPFWVRHADDTVSPQIVEGSQIDSGDSDQTAIWNASTHFNPVDLACALRDRDGFPFDLERFVDPDTVFVAEKSHEGRRLRALERPGLWNGAMAGWETTFVEVPVETFAPVKTVLDLLRPEHQPA